MGHRFVPSEQLGTLYRCRLQFLYQRLQRFFRFRSQGVNRAVERYGEAKLLLWIVLPYDSDVRSIPENIAAQTFNF
jgi:hypothetical protein